MKPLHSPVVSVGILATLTTLSPLLFSYPSLIILIGGFLQEIPVGSTETSELNENSSERSFEAKYIIYEELTWPLD